MVGKVPWDTKPVYEGKSGPLNRAPNFFDYADLAAIFDVVDHQEKYEREKNQNDCHDAPPLLLKQLVRQTLSSCVLNTIVIRIHRSSMHIATTKSW